MEFGWQLFALAIILTVSSVSAKTGGKCKVCDSSNDTRCLKELSAFEDKPCDTSCFTSIGSNGVLTRGCLSSTDKCEGKNCKSCDAVATACNAQVDHFWCKTCDSSTNSDCALWKSESSIPNEFCDSGVSKCLMEIKADKHTSRRCVSKSDETCPTDRKCDMCSDASCNKGIYPSNRRTCYQCSSDDSKCASPTKNPNDIKSFPCLFYEESDKCFEHGSSETTMARGCLSDATAYGKCSSESPKEKCKECSTNDCNVDEFKMESTVSCVQCKSEDAKCAGVHTSSDAQKCENKIEYWKPQGCYTNKIAAGKVEKGCIQDFDCPSTATCSTCTDGTACNTADATGTSCYVCRSDDTPACENKMADNSYPSKPCKNPTTAADTEQCYIERWREGGNIVIRNCLSDADAKTRKNCLDTNYKYCTVCKDNNCNLGEAPNSAHSIAVASGLLAISLLVLKFF